MNQLNYLLIILFCDFKRIVKYSDKEKDEPAKEI